MTPLDHTPAAVAPIPSEAARWGRAVACLAGLGVTLGVALDHMHVASGTISYTLPNLFGQAWWAFPLFAVAPVPLGIARPAAERLLGVDIVPPTWGATVVAVALFVSAYLASGLVPGGAAARCAVLGALFIAAWWVADRRPLGLLLAAGAAVAGTTVEVILVAAGQFAYAAPDALGVAAWLPVLYATAGVSVGALGSRLVDGA